MQACDVALLPFQPFSPDAEGAPGGLGPPEKKAEGKGGQHHRSAQGLVFFHPLGWLSVTRLASGKLGDDSKNIWLLKELACVFKPCSNVGLFKA